MALAAVAASDVQVATPDLVIDLSRFAATIDAARLDAAVIKAVKINILDTLSCTRVCASTPRTGWVCAGLGSVWALREPPGSGASANIRGAHFARAGSHGNR